MTETIEIVPSQYQQAIYDWTRTSTGSAVVIAVAGSGKTYTILQLLQLIPKDETAQLYAFNKPIADTLKRSIPHTCRNVLASTFHSAGYGALCRHFGMKQLETNSRKLQQICREKIPDFLTRRRYEAFICELVGLAKGVGIGCLVPDSYDAWEEIIRHHDLTLDDPGGKEEKAIQMARELLAWSNEAAESNFFIDFDDQLYLTVLWDLPLDRRDWVFVDEAQDTNAIRRAIIRKTLKPGGRLVAVGDPKQAIYGFTGASVDSIDLIAQEWNCIELPLSVCYRCPTAIVEKARELVPYIEAAPGAPRGAVDHLTVNEMLSQFLSSDVILCRNNAPLVELAYYCLGRGIAVQILGRKIGEGLTKLVDKMRSTTIDDLQVRLGEYRKREMQRLLDQDEHGRAQAVDDRVQCLYTLIDHLPEDARTVEELRAVLDRLYSDKIENKLTLSTVHKAKGGEWSQVAILKPGLMPAHWAAEGWEQEQETNLQYVAWTRARARLVFLSE